MSDTDDNVLGRIELRPGEPVTIEQARTMREGMERRTTSALAIYRTMRETGDLSGHLLVSYRCRKRGCQLLDVFPTPAGPAVYLPAFRYSPKRNAETHPSARERLTTDGERRWVERADLLDTDPPAGLGVEYWVQCDHLLDHPLPAERVNHDLATRRGELILLPD